MRRPDWAGRNYLLLTASASITGLGSAGALIATAFAVLEAGGDGSDVGLVAAARTVPLVVCLLIGGAVADRLPRHRVMVAANAVNCLSQGALAALVLSGEATIATMAVLAAFGGAGQAFFAPAAEGMLLSSVEGDQAGRAFALFRMGQNGSQIGGAALGGALIAAFGPGWVLAVDAAAFAVAAGLRAFLDVSHIPQRTAGAGLVRDLRDGWREVTTRPWLWSIVLQFALVNAVISAAEAVYGPLVAEEHLGGARPWGLALAAFGAGTLCSALVMTRLRPRRVLLTGILCVFPLALPSAALAVPLPAVVLAVLMFVAGCSIEVFGVTWMLALHQEIPEDKLSRVSSYDWFGSVALTPAAVALAGPAAETFGRSEALWTCSAVIVVLTAAVLTVPDVRRLRLRDGTMPAVAGTPVLPGPSVGAGDADPLPVPPSGVADGGPEPLSRC